MRLGLDPQARAARKRLAAFHAKLERDRIHAKASQFQATHTEEIIARPVENEESGETVFDLPARIAEEKPQAPYKLDDTGIDVVFDPTDMDTKELMRRFEMGSVADHTRQATFQNQVDSTPPEPVVFEWDGDTPDPFEGIKNLG